MAISRWSAKRLAVVWAAGILGEVMLFALPVMLARGLVNDAPRLLAEHDRTDSQWSIAEREDSISIAAQRRDAIRAKQFSVSAQGDTFVAVVHVPSGRPSSARVEEDGVRTVRQVWIVVAVLYGAIPLTLLGITAVWSVARLRSADQGI